MKKAREVLKELGEKIILDASKSKNPKIVLPVRSLSNIIYDKNKGTLV